jgi:hypothetical protein
MENVNALLVFLTGVFVRVALPSALTLLVIYFLRRLDLSWQAEARAQRRLQPEKPACWEIIQCSRTRRAGCPAFVSPEPCWQVHRLPSGYLRDDCLTCEVLRSAPAPARS